MSRIRIIQKSFVSVQCKLCDKEDALFEVDSDRDDEPDKYIEQNYGRAVIMAEKNGWTRPFLKPNQRYHNIHDTWLCGECLGKLRGGKVDVEEGK